jgi:hypothetical protein
MSQRWGPTKDMWKQMKLEEQWKSGWCSSEKFWSSLKNRTHRQTIGALDGSLSIDWGEKKFTGSSSEWEESEITVEEVYKKIWKYR